MFFARASSRAPTTCEPPAAAHMAFAATEGGDRDYALGHDTPRPAATEGEVRDYALGHDTPRAGHDVHEPELRHETTTRPRLATSPTNHFDTEAWQHIEALRALLQRVSDTETATLAAALSRLQVIYSSRATEAKEGTGCRATCKRRTAQLGARVVQCAAPALRWLAGTRAVAVASHWCTQIYRLYCVAERRLIELRARHPQYARWAMDVPAGVLSAAFFYGDVCSDALIASELHGARQRTWTALCILFILLPCLMAWVSTAAYLLQRRGGGSTTPPTLAPTPTRAPALSLSMTPDT